MSLPGHQQVSPGDESTWTPTGVQPSLTPGVPSPLQSEEPPCWGVPPPELPGDAGPGQQPPVLPQLLLPGGPGPAPGIYSL